MWTLRQARLAIIVAGCLGMIYTQLTTCSASIQFVRALGGSGLHVGILGALPTGMLFAQFLAAWVANRLHYRRRLWIGLSLIQRLMCIPVALGPWLFPEVSDVIWLWAFLITWALNQGLLHFCTPLWLSWMGDYLPKQGLNHYWGVRHLWMQLAAALSLVGAALLLRQSGGEIRFSFGVIVFLGCILGVIDILMFLRVDEPQVVRLENAGLWEVLSGPFRHEGFRSFINFSCFWHFATMIAAPFISLFLLDHVGMSVGEVLLLWTGSWIGGALSSKWLGRMAEVHGNRPILILCTVLKSINMLALLMVPAEPTWAFWILLPVFMGDMALNTGIAIANNGFLLKNSPAANRTMYIAAGTAVAGLVGGVTSILCGLWLTTMSGWSASLWGHGFNGYHVLFAVSIVLRIVSLALVTRIQEPAGSSARSVAYSLIGVGPLRVLRYPVGLYQNWTNQELSEAAIIPAPPSAASPPKLTVLSSEPVVEEQPAAALEAIRA